jgi:hypothetical protein
MGACVDRVTDLLAESKLLWAPIKRTLADVQGGNVACIVRDKCKTRWKKDFEEEIFFCSLVVQKYFSLDINDLALLAVGQTSTTSR